MQQMHFDENVVYVILKIDNAAIIRDARVTQIIWDPFRYFINGQWTISGAGPLRVAWDPRCST